MTVIYLIFLVVPALCKVIPDHIISSSCSLSSPDVSKCLLDRLNQLKQYFKTGIPELGVPVLDPMDMAEVDIDQKLSKTSWVKAKLTNLKSAGASGMQYDDLLFDPKDFTIEMNVSLPFISAATEYDFEGQFFMTGFRNTGYFNGTFSDIKVQSKATLEKALKKDVEVLQVNKSDFTMSLGGGRIHLVSNEPQKQVIADIAMRLFNENPQRMFATVAPFYIKTVSPYTNALMNNILGLVPFNELFTD